MFRQGPVSPERQPLATKLRLDTSLRIPDNRVVIDLGREAADSQRISRRVDDFMRGGASYEQLMRDLAAARRSAGGEEELRSYVDRMAKLGGLPTPLIAGLRSLLDRSPAPALATDGDPTRRTGPRRVYGGAATGSSGHGTGAGRFGDPLARLVGRVVVERYEIDAVIGRRTGGIAYRAIDRAWPVAENGGRRVTVIALDPVHAADAATVGRIARLAAQVRTLEHPVFDRIHEVVRDGDKVFAIVDYRVGRILAGLLAGGAGSGWPLRTVLPIGHRIADGLARAHRVGLVHGGISPETIILTADDDVHVLDFGLRAALMPGGDPEPRQDVLGLARSVHAMLIGAPMDAGDDPRRPSGLREPQWQALRNGLSLDPAARPSTAEALMVSLEDPGWLGRLVGR